MQNKSPEKTESARSNKIFLTVGLLLSLPFLLLQPIVFNKDSINVNIGNGSYKLEVAENNNDKTRGLSGRASMPDDQGMIFIYDEPDQRCMWMKDMNFPIDIIWLDENKNVIHIEKNVTPDTYPSSFCGTREAKYVIELNEGEADYAGLRVGNNIGISQ